METGGQKGSEVGRIGRMRDLAVAGPGICTLADERAKAGAACCRSGYPGLELSACALDTEMLVVMHSITPERGTHYGPEYES